MNEGGAAKTLVLIPALMALVAVALIAFGGSLTTTTILLAIWGLVGTAAPVGWWTWLANTLPRDAEAGGGLMVAVVQLAIMIGATGGGMLFDAAGYRASFGMSAVLFVVAAVLAALSERLVEIGVVPYYLHLLDRVRGAAHFEVADDEARRLHRLLRETLPGYAVPRLVREIPGERSKTWLM